MKVIKVFKAIKAIKAVKAVKVIKAIKVIKVWREVGVGTYRKKVVEIILFFKKIAGIFFCGDL